MKVYKILRKIGDKYFSCNPNLGSEIEQEYFIDKVNTPRLEGSLIYTFKDIRFADAFFQKYDYWIKADRSFELWVCKANRTQEDLRVVPVSFDFQFRVRQMWARKGFVNNFSFAPEGTVGCGELNFKNLIKTYTDES